MILDTVFLGRKISTLIFGQRQFDNFSIRIFCVHAYLQSRRENVARRGGSGANEMVFLGSCMGDYDKGWREFFAPAKLNRYFHKRGAPTHAPTPRVFDKVFASRIKSSLKTQSLLACYLPRGFPRARTPALIFADNNKLILKEPARKMFACSRWLLRLETMKAFSLPLFKKMIFGLGLGGRKNHFFER